MTPPMTYAGEGGLQVVMVLRPAGLARPHAASTRGANTRPHAGGAPPTQARRRPIVDARLGAQRESPIELREGRGEASRAVEAALVARAATATAWDEIVFIVLEQKGRDEGGREGGEGGREGGEGGREGGEGGWDGEGGGRGEASRAVEAALVARAATATAWDDIVFIVLEQEGRDEGGREGGRVGRRGRRERRGFPGGRGGARGSNCKEDGITNTT